MAHIDGKVEPEEWIYSGRWSQYRKGDTVPSGPTANKLELLFSNTKIWLLLPVWELSGPLPSPTRINELICTLREDAALLYFEINLNLNKSSRNRAKLERLFRALNKLGDVEALTVCIALCRTAEHDEDPRNLFYATLGAMRIFRKLAAFGPFFYIAADLNQLWRETVYRHELFEIWGVVAIETEEGTITMNQHLDERLSFERLDTTRLTYNDILFYLEYTLPVENNPSLRRACLYLADQYGMYEACWELRNFYVSNRSADPSGAIKLPFHQYLAKRLRSFPFTTSAVDWVHAPQGAKQATP